jgi:hypothetical protein
VGGENADDLEKLKADLLIHTYAPVNAAEWDAVERIVLAWWSILRGYQLEAGSFTSFADSAWCRVNSTTTSVTRILPMASSSVRARDSPSS